MYHLRNDLQLPVQKRAQWWVLCFALGLALSVSGDFSSSIGKSATPSLPVLQGCTVTNLNGADRLAYTSRFLRMNDYLLHGTNTFTAIA